MSATIMPTLIPVNKQKLLAKELKAIKRWKADQIEWEESREARMRSKYRSRDEDYCKHGTYIGDPYGADYLCGYCESSVSDYEFVIGFVQSDAYNAQRRYDSTLKSLMLHADYIRECQEKGGAALNLIPMFAGWMAKEIRTLEETREQWF